MARRQLLDRYSERALTRVWKARSFSYWMTCCCTGVRTKPASTTSLFGWIDAIPPALCTLGQPQDGDWSLPAGVFDRATRQWHQQAARILRKQAAPSKKAATAQVGRPTTT